MKLIFSLLVLLFGLHASVIAQSQDANLQLFNEHDEGVAYATVIIRNNATATGGRQYLQTDEEGKVSFKYTKLPIFIEIQALGYKYSENKIDNIHHNRLKINLERDYTGLSEVVITGLSKPTRLDEAVSMYQIITQEDIRSQGAVTLNEALRNELGLNIGQDMMLGSTISMRGISGSNVKILIDGLPLNGREGGNIDMSQINLSNIERIERVQGPMSVVYGTDALGGVINLITKKNQKDWMLGARLFYETIGKYNASIEVGRVWKKHKIYLHAGRNFFEGWDPEYNVSETRAPLWRPKELLFANVKYDYKISDKANITYAMDIGKELLVIKSDSAGYSLNPTAPKRDMYYTTTRWINRLQGNWKLGKSGFIESNNSFAMYDRNLETKLIDLTNMESRLSPRDGDQTTTTFQDFTSRSTYNNHVGIFDYTVGYDINLQFASGVDKLKEGSKKMGDYAFFTSANIKIHQFFTVQPAIRLIHNTIYKAPLVPSLGVLYKPLNALQIRASYGRGFRAPSLKELYLDFKDNNHDVMGSETLKAEYAHHVQVSAGYTLFEKEKKSSIISLTGFYDDIRNQISLAALPGADTLPTNAIVPFSYANIGRTRFLTVQLKNEYQLNQLKLNVGLSYNRSFKTASQLDDGNMFETPDFYYFEANSSLRYYFDKWKAGVGIYYKYTGSQPRLGSDIMGNSIFGSKMQDFHIIDGSFEKRFLGDKILLNIGVRNLTNVQRLNTGGSSGGHGSSATFITPGRSIFASLNVKMGK